MAHGGRRAALRRFWAISEASLVAENHVIPNGKMGEPLVDVLEHGWKPYVRRCRKRVLMVGFGPANCALSRRSHIKKLYVAVVVLQGMVCTHFSHPATARTPKGLRVTYGQVGDLEIVGKNVIGIYWELPSGYVKIFIEHGH